MQNNNQQLTAQALQPYADRIRTEIQNAGGYQINGINPIDGFNMIAMELSNEVGRKIQGFFQTDDNNKWNVYMQTGKTYTFDNFELALDYFSEQIRSNAVKNYIDAMQYYDDIKAVINNVNGYTINTMFCDLDKNDFGNTIKISLTNPAGEEMNIRLKIQNDGRCYLENQSIDQNGRTFDNVDSALQSLKDKLMSNQWRNYIANVNVNVNNIPAHYQPGGQVYYDQGNIVYYGQGQGNISAGPN